MGLLKLIANFLNIPWPSRKYQGYEHTPSKFRYGEKVFVNAEIRNYQGNLVKIRGYAKVVSHISSNNLYKIKFKGQAFYVRGSCLSRR